MGARGGGAAADAAGEAALRFPPALAQLQPEGDGTLLRMRADRLDWVAGLLAGAGCEFRVRGPAALRDAVRALGHRLAGI